MNFFNPPKERGGTSKDECGSVILRFGIVWKRRTRIQLRQIDRAYKIGYIQTMELDYTYFEAEDGFFVGWFDDFPEDVTQGKTLEELETMLADVYACLNLAKYHKRKLILA